MALNIVETIINGFLEPITAFLDPKTGKTSTQIINPHTVAPATTTAAQVATTPAQAQSTPVVDQNTQAAANPTPANADTQPAAAAPTTAAVIASNNAGGGSAVTSTAAAGGAGASPSTIDGNTVVSTTVVASVAVVSSIANNNIAGPVSLTSNAVGNGKSSYISLISTFTTTFTSPQKTLTEIIGIEEPNGETTTITVTGTNTKYLTTTDTVSVSIGPSSTAGSLSSSKHSSNGGKIAGAAIGSLAGLALMILAVAFCLRRKKEKDSRRVSTIAGGAGVTGYEKQVDHYSRQPLPPLPSGGDRDSGQQMSETDSRSSHRFSAAALAARKKLGLSKQPQRPHVLEWPKEFAAGGIGDDVHEGV